MRKYYLSIIVWFDYFLRKEGIKPDEWHWADKELLKLGFYTNSNFPWPRKLLVKWMA